jgi:hypothetical protein
MNWQKLIYRVRTQTSEAYFGNSLTLQEYRQVVKIVRRYLKELKKENK